MLQISDRNFSVYMTEKANRR